MGDTSVVTATEDRLWLLSVSEVYGKELKYNGRKVYSSATYDAEGTQYQLYADQCVTTKNHGFCKKDGADSWWWLRSPNAYISVSFHYVYVNGVWGNLDADNSGGVAPGFCF